MKSIPSLTLAFVASLAAGRAAAAEPTTLASPDGKLAVSLAIAAPELPGYPAGKPRLYYRVEHGAEGDRIEVLPWSPLGIVRDDQSFVDGLTLRAQSRVFTIDETYRLAHGKRSECRSLANEQSFLLENTAGEPVEVVFRVANDGLAFRYRFPGPVGRAARVMDEASGFRLPGDGRAWMTPYSAASMYTPAYEEYYLHDIPVATASPQKEGWALPALFRIAEGKRWVLVTEAAVDGTYCGCRLAQQAPDGVYRIRFPDSEEGWKQGEITPSAKLPWATPWRVIVVGESPATIVESTLVTDLNPPSQVVDTSWIKPGRVSWSWWSDHDSPQDYRAMAPFVDLAAEMGWEYFLVDANWTLMNHGNVRELADYARSKGVGLFLWYNSGGDHNIVTEKPRGTMNLPEVRKFEFELLRKWGVKGVKIDFFQSDKQNIMSLYHDILRDAAAAEIMVNFHGCTVPRGWQRTWPHLMSMEAVRGEECYTFAAEYPEKAPQYNTILPFTRNAVGPMDYTPCGFTDDRYPHLTTNAHELALAVVFESGLLHFADRVNAYRELPDAPKAFLRDVPVAWDETRYIAGAPGEYVVLARRRGNDWYVGAINGRNEPLPLSVPLAFLAPGGSTGTLIADGEGPRQFAARQVTLKPNDRLELSLLPYGGAALRLSPTGAQGE